MHRNNSARAGSGRLQRRQVTRPASIPQRSPPRLAGKSDATRREKLDRKQHDRCAPLSSHLLARHQHTRTFCLCPAGAGGGLVASIATCPLDVVKTKLQAQRAILGQPGYQGVLGSSHTHPHFRLIILWSDIIKTTLRHDGIRGMYRGLGPTILGYLPTWAIYFAVYDGIKRRFGEPPLGEPVPPGRIYPAAQPKGYQPAMRDHPWTLHILSAMIAGATSTTCTNPLWVIKTRFMVCPPRCDLACRSPLIPVSPRQTQSRREVRYRHTFDAALTIYRTEGLRAFYRGLLPSLFGIAHVAVQFPLYEQLKVWARALRWCTVKMDSVI
ncbi:mitochondrial carrier domain-containing protein [Boletus reticuloceps]|uniref:Mitochondrial carrier domain-containing protein n=1 Tax=Boletus reticuloceps TaxID=495285 RepID=A0A8I2YIY0_9AGAM|nr:mitochondrial carrier domain-containing protein [Boletus reticuloceps]